MKSQPMLHLLDCTYSGLNLVPTDALMKPVLVLRCPFTAQMSVHTGCSWLYDAAGNPVEFSGTVKIPVEYSGPELKLVGAKSEMVVKMQKIVGFNVSPGQGEETGLFLTLRAHMPPTDVTDARQMAVLMEAIRFVAALNKAPFTVDINPAQLPLFAKGTQPTDDTGLANEGDRTVLTFTTKIKHKPAIEVEMTILLVEEGKYLPSWQVKAPGFKDAAAGHQAKDDDPTYTTQQEAVNWAAQQVLTFLHKGLDPDGGEQQKAVGTMRTWVYTQAPGLEIKEAAKNA